MDRTSSRNKPITKLRIEVDGRLISNRTLAR
jgi:hypothetical protein